MRNHILIEQIDGAACYIDVGSSYPGRAEDQGWGCSPIKRDRELGSERCETVCLISTGDVRMSDGKGVIVREELALDASGLSVIRQGKQSSYALRDKC